MKKLTAFGLILAVLFLFGCEPNTEEGNSIAVTGVTLLPSSISSLPAGGTTTLIATVNPSNAPNKNVTWTSSNTSIATVVSGGLNADGKPTAVVTGVAVGSATITVKTADGDKTKACAVTVTTPIAVSGVTLNESNLSVFTGKTRQLAATVNPENATNKNVTWSSSDPTKATVTQTGLVTGVAVGSATITATSVADTTKKANCTVTVQFKEPGANGVSANGQLKVSGADLVNKDNQQFQLYGMSTAGIHWYGQFVNKDAFTTLHNDWNTNCVRIAMYTAEGGYGEAAGTRDNLKTTVKNAVTWATELDMYVIIDWHVMNDGSGNDKGSPLVYVEEAKAFFGEMSLLYKDSVNVLYEICNEPNGAGGTWANVKSYANQVIPVIRANSPNAVIIVGTPEWSQKIDTAASDKLNFTNIMYTLHFYAADHDFLRSRLTTYYNQGLPIFISEFAICKASGNGNNDFEAGERWKELVAQNNLSFMAWNLANKNESSCVIASNCYKTSAWLDSELTDWGKWIKAWFVSQP